MVVIKGAGVLGDDVKWAAESAECAAIDGVRVCDAVDFWSRGMDGVVDHVCCLVQEANGSAFHDISSSIDENEIRGFEVGPRDAEWIHPKGGWLDSVLDSLLVHEEGGR